MAQTSFGVQPGLTSTTVVAATNGERRFFAACVSNDTASAETLTLTLVKASGALANVVLYPGLSVPAGGQLILSNTTNHAVNAGDSITASASAAASLDVLVTMTDA